MEQSIEQLQEVAAEMQAQYERLKAMPATRQSAMGGMIKEAWVLQQMEEVDARLGKINALIERMKNPSDQGKTYYIRYGHNHVVPCVVRHGVLESGGLLPNYFVGRRASEHEDYVRNRHNKRMVLVSLDHVVFNGNERVKGDMSTVDNGRVAFEIKLDEAVFKFEADFTVPVNEKEHFYIAFQNKTIKPVGSERGASEHQRDLATYAAAHLYQRIIAPNKSIGIR